MNTTTQILEGPRVEAGVNVKLDTSLEMELNNKFNENSSFESCSASSDASSSDKGGCQHNKLVVQDNYNSCFHCGIYVPKNGVKVYKSVKMNYQALFPSKIVYETLTKRSTHFEQSVNAEYIQIRQSYIEWILELADKLRISNNSSHLAVLLLDTIMFKDISLTTKLQLYAPVCLLLASKTIELDERIPFIPKLRRYANPSFSIDDYRRAELKVLDIVDWNPQFSSALELTEFLMCQGVLFSTDEVEEQNGSSEHTKLNSEVLRENNQHENTHHIEMKAEDKKEILKQSDIISSPTFKENNENSCSDASTIGTNTDIIAVQAQAVDEEPSPKNVISPLLRHTSGSKIAKTQQSTAKVSVSIEKKLPNILNHFESSYTKLSTLILKDSEFVGYEPKTVAASNVAFLRYINKISPIWNSDLEIITDLKFSQISPCFELIHKKYNIAFNTHTPKLQNIFYSPGAITDINADIKLNRTSSLISDKMGSGQKVEPISKPNVANSLYTRSNTCDLQNAERKPVLNHQTKAGIPLANIPSSKYLNGTINTEIPQRQPLKNQIFTNNVQQKGFNNGQDYLAPYYSNNSAVFSNGASNVPSANTTATGYTAANNSGHLGENFLRNDPYISKNLGMSNRTSTLEGITSFQSKINSLKK